MFDKGDVFPFYINWLLHLIRNTLSEIIYASIDSAIIGTSRTKTDLINMVIHVNLLLKVKVNLMLKSICVSVINTSFIA